MSNKLKSTLRLISVLLALIIVAMYFGFLPGVDILDEFWVMVLAYALLLVTIK